MTSTRIAIVTGTSSGIGLSLAPALLDDGWQVVGLSRRPASISHPNYRHFSFDLGQTEALTEFAEANLAPILRDPALDRVGLVNNAAMIGSLRGLNESDPVHLAKVLAVNVVAPTYLMGLVARNVLPTAELRIVNVSSGAASQGIPGLGDYCASKAALRLAGMSMAAEFAAAEDSRDATLLSYAPGIVDTEMQEATRGADPAAFPSFEMFKGFADRGELERPEDVIARISTFLADGAGPSFVEARFGDA